jgi:uncharacterized protein YndB with AHSA1/START domain
VDGARRQEVTRVEVGERPGGYWRTWKADSGTVVGGFDSELLELAPDQRLVFRWGYIAPQRRQGPSLDTRLTVTLGADPPGTALTLVREDLAELAAAMSEIAASVGPGWEALLANLTRCSRPKTNRPDIPILVLGHGGQARPMTRPWKEGEAIRGRNAGERRRFARNEKPTHGRRDP